MFSHKVQKNLPDFFILGSPKCGTTSLYMQLMSNNGIFLSSKIKEPNFFLIDGLKYNKIENQLPDLWKDLIYDVENYASLFGEARPDQIIGEATPEYLSQPGLFIQNIQKYYSEDQLNKLKFIVMIRNPVERLWSHYNMMCRDGYENLDFFDAIDKKTIEKRLLLGWHFSYDYLIFGYYALKLNEYFKFFNQYQFKIINLTDYVNDQEGTLKSIADFLNVPFDFDKNILIQFNQSGNIKNTHLHKFLFKNDSFLKDIARIVIPFKYLMFIKAQIIKLNTEKKIIDKNLYNELFEIYENDVKELNKICDLNISWGKI